LLVAAKLGVQPQHCVVVEDSVAGVAAARAAGMKCAGFAPTERLPGLAAAAADDLISEFPGDAPRYFKRLITGDETQTAASKSRAPHSRG
jgi:beta-phosphoglucomutase-like phosphatase (HAD superfamily)